MYKQPQLSIIWSILLCFSLNLLSAQNEAIPETLQSNFTNNSRPNWLKIRGNKTFNKRQFLSLVDEVQGGNEASVFTLKTTKEGKKGRIRYVYEQVYKDFLIENHRWVLHEE